MKLYKKICALVLLIAVTLTLTSCGTSKTAEQPEYTMLTISAPSGSFDSCSIAELALCGCDIGDDSITLNFGGLITDGRKPSDDVGGTFSSVEGEGYGLRVGEEVFTEGPYDEIFFNQSFLQVDLEFKVPDSSLIPGTSCALLYRDDTFDEYTELMEFSLVGVTELQSLTGVQAVKETDNISVAASATAIDGGYTCVKLYPETSNGLELLSYGIGGGELTEDVSFNHLGLLDSQRGLSLQTNGETLYPLGFNGYSWFFPSCFIFETGDETEFTLDLPYVVYRGEALDVTRGSFTEKQAQEAYSESIPVEYGALNLSLQSGENGALRLCCSAERTDETFRLCGLDYVVNGSAKSIALQQIGDSESPQVVLAASDDDIQAIGAEIKITGVYYAQVVDLELPLTIN